MDITLPPVKKKKKHSEQMKAAAAFAKFGVHALRVKAETLAALGGAAERAGIRKLGHGRILLAADNAEQAVSSLNGYIEEMLKQDPPPDKNVILEVMRWVHAFNDQIIETAKAHFATDKAPVAGENTAHITMPYPAGQSMVVAIGQQSEPTPAPVTRTKKPAELAPANVVESEPQAE